MIALLREMAAFAQPLAIRIRVSSRRAKKMFRITVILLFLGNFGLASEVATNGCHIVSRLHGSEPGNTGEPVIVSPRNHFLTTFQNYSPLQIAKVVSELYPEIQWLTSKVHISPEDANAKPHPLSPSVALHGSLHPEVDRTITSVVALQQILAGDYNGFTQGQPEAIRLKPESFNKIRSIFTRVLAKDGSDPARLEIDGDKLDALIAYMAIHDLGKSKAFSNVVESVTLKVDADHDRILVYGLTSEPMLALSYSRLPEKFRKLILAGMEADFNMGQFAQAENIPASMKKLEGLSPEAFDFYFVHLFLDVAGASGVKNPLGSQLMIEPVFGGFSAGYDFLPALARGDSPEVVYDRFLKDRADKVGLPLESKRDRAVMRLALQTRAINPAKAKQVSEVFHSLPKNVQDLLVKELNVNGTDDGMGTLQYYSPALIANAIKGHKAIGRPILKPLECVLRIWHWLGFMPKQEPLD